MGTFSSAQGDASPFVLYWFPLITLVVGALLGAVVSHWYEVRLRRPRLELLGAGGSGSQTGRATRHLSVWNSPYRFTFELGGVSVGRRTIFGGLSRQVLATREPAIRCQAWLLSADGKRTIASLQWRPEGGQAHEAKLDAGGSRDLLMIATDVDEPDRFHLYRVDPSTGDDRSPEAGHTFTGPQDFLVQINYNHALTKRWPIRIRLRAHGVWDVLVRGDDLW